MRKYEHPLRLTYFLFMDGYQNLYTSVFSREFVDLICERKYLSFYPQAMVIIVGMDTATRVQIRDETDCISRILDMTLKKLMVRLQ